MSDESTELVRRMQEGDPTAFKDIFNLYQTKAVRTAYLITKNYALAEDATQETFIICYKKINELKNPEQFSPWFYKTLTRTAWKLVKKEKGSVPIENIFEIAQYQHFERELTRNSDVDVSDKFIEAISKLKEKQQTAIYLYYYHEFSISEIAKIMNCFEGTVKSRLYSARNNLKNSLKLEEDSNKEDMKNDIIYKF